jgi:hypothetical protein
MEVELTGTYPNAIVCGEVITAVGPQLAVVELVELPVLVPALVLPDPMPDVVVPVEPCPVDAAPLVPSTPLEPDSAVSPVPELMVEPRQQPLNKSRQKEKSSRIVGCPLVGQGELD